MMPGMDGFALCEKLKNDERTSHIPVILLTARASGESKLQGLQQGADDYITKPFDMRELHARIRNLIAQRQQLRLRFSREALLRPEELSIPSMDVAFLNRIREAVVRNLENAEFGVEDLARSVGLSSSQLRRKLQALTGLSPNQFIRRVRLLRAEELLRRRAGTVSEIAYAVGFNNLSYFAKCFQAEFGSSPSEYARRASAGTSTSPRSASTDSTTGD